MYYVVATIAYNCIDCSYIYIICCCYSSISTLCGQRPVCIRLVRYVSDRDMYSCFDIYLLVKGSLPNR